MQSKARSDTHEDSSISNVSNSFLPSQLWFNNTQSFNPLAMRDKKSDSSSLEQSTDSQSRSEGRVNGDNNIAKQSKGSNCEREGRDFLKDSSTICVCSDNAMQPPHLELVVHSIACAVNSYDPYGGMMAAYGQPSGPFMYDMHQARMMLPREMAQEPVYVNAKQYHGILRRRQARAKAELEKKLIKVRKPYLHESRHQHALRRARGSGGRFAKKSDTDTLKETQSTSAVSLQSLGHSCNNDVSSSRKQNNSAESVYQRQEGRASDQQWRSFMSNRALAMQ